MARIEGIRIQNYRSLKDVTLGKTFENQKADLLVVVEQLDHSIERYISDCAWEAGFPEDVIVVPIVISLDTLRNSPIRDLFL